MYIHFKPKLNSMSCFINFLTDLLATGHCIKVVWLTILQITKSKLEKYQIISALHTCEQFSREMKNTSE